MIFNVYQRKTGIMGDIMVKKSGRVTIKSIAEELGISFSTVAKALNDDPVIRQETRELVQNKAKEMNYTRNYFAQGLRQKGSKTVAIILNEIDIPAYGEMIAMISADLAEHGYTTLISDSRYSEEAERSCIETVLTRMPEAVIISPANPESPNMQLLNSLQSNTLILGELDSSSKANTLAVSHRRAGYLSARHMLSCGNRRNLVFCGPQEFQSGRLFYQGVLDAYAEKGLSLCDDDVFWFKPGEQRSAKQFTRIWTERHGEIDGVICFCDSMAFGIYRAALQLGLRIPDDISVIGYDDSSLNDFSSPPLTTVHMPKDLVAQYCSRFVLDRLIHGSTEKFSFLLEPSLVKRASVASRPEP